MLFFANIQSVQMSPEQPTSNDPAWQHYLADFDLIPGWLERGFIDVLCALDEYHEQAGVEGSVGEIGVYYGKLFVPLYLICRPGYHALAADCFENFDPNLTSRDTLLIRDYFTATLKHYVGTPDRLRVMQCDSLNCTPQSYHEAVEGTSFRLFSIDGCHSAKHVTKDLMNASAVLTDGHVSGIILVDDYFNPKWAGVTKGVDQFVRSFPDRLAPVLLGWNKLLLCRPESATGYKSFLSTRLNVHTTRTLLNSEVLTCESGSQ